ncbi:MAG: outer membrane protein assembly factor BamB family protein [Methanobacteriota archaeon]
MQGTSSSLLVVMSLVAASSVVAVAPAAASCDWPAYGRGVLRTFATGAGCSSIGTDDAARLAPRWFLPTADSVTASPTVVDGVVYVGSWDGTFYAIPADAGPLAAPLWTFAIDDANDVSFGRIVSTAAVATVAGTRIVAFGGGSTLYVLDAESGAELARACLDPRAEPAPPASPVRCRGSEAEIEIESSPAVVEVDGDPWILVGHGVHNRPGVGRTGLVALELSAAPWGLAPVWKFDPERRVTLTSDAEKAGSAGFLFTTSILTDGAGTGSGCGGVWGSPAVEPDDGIVFFGTANCEADSVPDGEHGGEAAYALDLWTGGLLWTYAPRGLNRLDDDFGATPNVLPGGRVGFGGKDGRYYAFAQEGEVDGSADLRWTSRPGQAGHLVTDFAFGGVIGTPAVGRVGATPAIFVATALSTPIGEPVDSHGPNVDASLAEDPGRMMSLHAIRASDGAVLWRSPVARASFGAPVYADGIVFVPSTFDSSVKAFDADDGRLLASVPLNGPPSSAPVVVGDTLFVGAGTRETDAEFKTFQLAGIEPVAGDHALSRLAGVWAFSVR